MPRTIPWSEREWLSCTISSGIPSSVKTLVPVGLAEEAALVADDRGSIRIGPSSLVSSLHACSIVL